MNPHDQLEEALALLRETGMTRNSYAPPPHRLLWRRGILVRPPHFAPFHHNMLGTALWFAPLWGFLMWFLVWSGQGQPLWIMLGASVLAGLLVGILMAIFYQENARKNHLPPWDAIPQQQEKPGHENQAAPVTEENPQRERHDPR